MIQFGRTVVEPWYNDFSLQGRIRFTGQRHMHRFGWDTWETFGCDRLGTRMPARWSREGRAGRAVGCLTWFICEVREGGLADVYTVLSFLVMNNSIIYIYTVIIHHLNLMVQSIN
jgi:hypothetical protein